MKRQFQIFAMLLTVLLAGGPSLTAAACTINNIAMGASCPMGMAEMGASCPMAQSLATADCSGDCCNRAQSPVVAVQDVPVKPTVLAIALHFEQPIAMSTAKTDSTPESASSRVAASPPLHVLNCVFRI